MREKIKINYTSKGSLNFLYNTVVGRGILKILTKPVISKIVGAFMSTRFSTVLIRRFIQKNNINMDEYEKAKYSSYNDFFTRKILPEKRVVDMNTKNFISPCDSKLTAYTISDDLSFNIKGTKYTVASLIQDKEIAKEFFGGYILIFRLSVDDYHRYCYIDNGKKTKNTFIKGILHTVQPVALNNFEIYKTNSREYTILHTDNFGDIIQVEVGAMMVGKIKNLHDEYTFAKGEEKGYFEFGGSTICILVKKDVVDLDDEILENTKNEFETKVKYGERIGEANEKK